MGLAMGHVISGRGTMWATWRATLERARPQQRLGHVSERVRPCSSGLFLPSSAFPPSFRSGETGPDRALMSNCPVPGQLAPPLSSRTPGSCVHLPFLPHNAYKSVCTE